MSVQTAVSVQTLASPLVVVQCDRRHRIYWCECLVSQDGNIGCSTVISKCADVRQMGAAWPVNGPKLCFVCFLDVQGSTFVALNTTT